MWFWVNIHMGMMFMPNKLSRIYSNKVQNINDCKHKDASYMKDIKIFILKRPWFYQFIISLIKKKIN